MESTERKAIKKPKVRRVEYLDLLRYIHKVIMEKYGTIQDFVNHADYVTFGFDPKKRTSVMAYLSIPKEGGEKKVKSLPVLKKLYSGLLGVEVDSKVEVQREFKIWVPDTLQIEELKEVA